MATSSEKTESALRSISMCWLVQALFTKYAPKFADKVDWKEFAACGKEERKNLVSTYKSQLREKSPSFHNELCGALNIIMIAAESRKIKGFMRKMISGKGTLVKRFNHEALRKVIGDGSTFVSAAALPQDGSIISKLDRIMRIRCAPRKVRATGEKQSFP